MTILVVDDEISYRLLMKTMLMDSGYEVLLAEDGEEAVEKLEESGVDLIISDIYMPVMDGFKLHKKIRSTPKWEKLPVLFISAYDDQHTLDIVKNPKMEAFIKKGRPVAEIMEWISYLTSSEDQRPSHLPGSRLGSRRTEL